MMRTYSQAVQNIDNEPEMEVQYFPIEIWILIWKNIFSSSVLEELKKHGSVWCPGKKQSRKLNIGREYKEKT